VKSPRTGRNSRRSSGGVAGRLHRVCPDWLARRTDPNLDGNTPCDPFATKVVLGEVGREDRPGLDSQRGNDLETDDGRISRAEGNGNPSLTTGSKATLHGIRKPARDAFE
jgi:hypothetical protein